LLARAALAGAALVPLLAPATSAAQATSPTFRITVLRNVPDVPGTAGGTVALGINEIGQVAGGGYSGAMVWDGTGGVQSLGLPPSSTARAINGAGAVAGYYRPPGIYNNGFFWSPAGGLTGLGDLPGGQNSSEAWDINASGMVVGQGTPASGFEAFVWTSAGGMQGLGWLPAAYQSHGYGINDAGKVVGSSGGAGFSHAFLWTAQGGMQDLGALPGSTFSRAFKINNADQVVGFSKSGTNDRAFSWSEAAGLQDLGELPGGLDLSRAQDINDAGWIVGYSGSTAGIRATVWQPGAGPIDLNDLVAADDPLRGSISLDIAYGINNVGQIVGSGTTAGRTQGFLLTPVSMVPEPSNWLMLVAGLGVVLRRTRRNGTSLSF
jgi:probable HAF family extracellular repeat protein